MRREATYLAVCVLLASTLACNISNPRGPITPTPEAATVVATGTQPGPAEAPTKSSNLEGTLVVEATPTLASSSDSSNTGAGTPESSGSSGAGGGGSSTTGDNDIFDSVSIKNGNTSYKGHVSFPGGDTSDNIDIKPIGFDNAKKEGNLTFKLTCSGRGKAKINYKGGAVKSGSPGCGGTWTIYVIDGSPDSQILIHLDASGDVNWSLTVTGGG
jgi:hypothetical protein